MSRPSWVDAPEWAKWLAQDSDGEWFWYSARPHCLEHKAGWIEEAGSFTQWARKTSIYNPWQQTLERRP